MGFSCPLVDIKRKNVTNSANLGITKNYLVFDITVSFQFDPTILQIGWVVTENLALQQCSAYLKIYFSWFIFVQFLWSLWCSWGIVT